MARRLRRVGDPNETARTHTVVVVRIDHEQVLCDPGFRFSTLRAIPLIDGVDNDHAHCACAWCQKARGRVRGSCTAEATTVVGSSPTRTTIWRSVPPTLYPATTARALPGSWYDRDGNLVKRVRDNLFSDARLSNPVTGASVPYEQHDSDTDIFATPEDLDSATTGRSRSSQTSNAPSCR